LAAYFYQHADNGRDAVMLERCADGRETAYEKVGEITC
jgi:hypothetical protein